MCMHDTTYLNCVRAMICACMIIQVLRSDGHGINLEYYAQVALKNKWKAFYIRLGPVLFENLLCTHPDTAKEILKNGRERI